MRLPILQGVLPIDPNRIPSELIAGVIKNNPSQQL